MSGRIGKGSDVVDGERVQCIRGPAVHDLEDAATAHVVGAEIIHHNVMNAPAGAGLGWGSALPVAGHRGCQLHSTARMRDLVVAEGHVGDFAN